MVKQFDWLESSQWLIKISFRSNFKKGKEKCSLKSFVKTLIQTMLKL